MTEWYAEGYQRNLAARGIVNFLHIEEIKPEHLVQVLTHLHCR
jgi:hypothetical protein